MNTYNLVLTDTGEIINTIFWDGSDPDNMSLFTSSFGYELQLVTDQDNYYHLTGSLSESYSSSFNNESQYSAKYSGQFVGSFTGSFSGEISGSSTGSQTDIIIKSQNWTPPTWAKKIKVVLVGGGGGGGSATSEEDGIVQYTGGGGGGGGTITFGEFSIDDLTTGSISVTIGSAGLGGNDERGGTNGGDTLFGDYLIAPGGFGGIQGNTGVSVSGGDSRAIINLLNTGGGPGGRGTCDAFANDPSITPQIVNQSVAPGLPIRRGYVDVLNYQRYTSTWPMPIPASIAPTGGGGGLGYKPGDGRYGDGVDTYGGSILQYSLSRLNSVTPIEYNSSSYSHYPAFNTKVGLGGKGGNGYLLSGPTQGTDYGGGGGGAYAGGLTGSYIDGTPNGTQYNFGANGGSGVAIIISET